MTPHKFINFSDWLDKSTGHDVISALVNKFDRSELYLALKDVYDEHQEKVI